MDKNTLIITLGVCLVIAVITFIWSFVEHKKLSKELDQADQKIKLLVEENKKASDQIRHRKELIQTEEQLASAKAAAQENFEREINKLVTFYDSQRDMVINDYEQLLADNAQEAANKIAEYDLQVREAELKLEDIHQKTHAAVEAQKRAQEEKEKEEFYKVHIPEEDIKEIKELRALRLRDMEPVNKIIWKYYYEKPATELVGRLINTQNVTGIYRITNLTNGRCYVGQSVNIKTRLLTHIKRGLGAEQPTKNKLYPAMYEEGPESFKYEIIELCPEEKLDEREKYWQKFFLADTYGYSMR